MHHDVTKAKFLLRVVAVYPSVICLMGTGSLSELGVLPTNRRVTLQLQRTKQVATKKQHIRYRYLRWCSKILQDWAQLTKREPSLSWCHPHGTPTYQDVRRFLATLWTKPCPPNPHYLVEPAVKVYTQGKNSHRHIPGIAAPPAWTLLHRPGAVAACVIGKNVPFRSGYLSHSCLRYHSKHVLK
jgi:hypothetical protein